MVVYLEAVAVYQAVVVVPAYLFGLMFVAVVVVMMVLVAVEYWRWWVLRYLL